MLSGTELQVTGRSPESVFRENHLIRQSMNAIALQAGFCLDTMELPDEAIAALKEIRRLAEIGQRHHGGSVELPRLQLELGK